MFLFMGVKMSQALRDAYKKALQSNRDTAVVAVGSALFIYPADIASSFGTVLAIVCVSGEIYHF